jgi:uncharacterized protein YjbI with pentapeptide repeats
MAKAKKKGAAVSSGDSAPFKRLAGKKVLFVGKFDWGVDRLKVLAREHGATLAKDLNANVDYLVLPDVTSNKGVRAQAQKLNAKGAAIQILDAGDFGEAVKLTEEEIIAVMRRGNAKAADLLGEALYDFRFRGSGKRVYAIEITGQSFAGLKLATYDLEPIAFDDCDFTGADLLSTEFSKATRCNFDKAIGEAAEFEIVTGSSFRGAKLKKVEFEDEGEISDCDFSGGDFTEGEFEEYTYRKKRKTSGVKFRDAILRLATFTNLVFIEPDFRGADLTKARFAECTFESPDFTKANLAEASLAAADLKNANFSGADLRKAILVDAKLAGANFAGADLTGCNLRGADVKGVDFSKAKGYKPPAPVPTAAGAALKELDKVLAKAKRVKFEFRLAEPAVGSDPKDDDKDRIAADSASLGYGHGVDTPVRLDRGYGSRKTVMSAELLRAARVIGDVKIRFETLQVKSTKAKVRPNELRDLITRALCEAFSQEKPDMAALASVVKAHRAGDRKRQQQLALKRRKQRERWEKQAEKSTQRELQKVEKKVAAAVGGKVGDVASFLKALEVRADKAKIDKATSMLKAEKFQLFNDITDDHMAGVVKSQSDPDLVYACRISSDGHFGCCTQNLNICGGLRGSVCKHLLVLIIGLVKAGKLDPGTIDGWIAQSGTRKPELDKEKMGEIFVRYKGAEAGEIDWRPTETVPEDYYAL